jgi:hypothetical protein
MATIPDGSEGSTLLSTLRCALFLSYYKHHHHDSTSLLSRVPDSPSLTPHRSSEFMLLYGDGDGDDDEDAQM